MEVIFVCTGNICRSPMAEYLLRDKLSKAGLIGKITVSSAGVAPLSGREASKNAQKAMQEMGISMRAHRSSGLTVARARAAELILTMTAQHKAQLQGALPPKLWSKLHTLPEFVGARGDVADPYGGDLDVYRRCRTLLDSYIDAALPQLAALAQQPANKTED